MSCYLHVASCFFLPARKELHSEGVKALVCFLKKLGCRTSEYVEEQKCLQLFQMVTFEGEVKGLSS